MLKNLLFIFFLIILIPPLASAFTQESFTPWTQNIIDLRNSKSQVFQDTFPIDSDSDINQLLAWAGNPVAQTNNPELQEFGHVYSAMKRWNERIDLQVGFPESNLGNDVSLLLAWAGNDSVLANIEYSDMDSFESEYVLFRLFFLQRDDLRDSSVFSGALDLSDPSRLFCWASKSHDLTLTPYYDNYTAKRDNCNFSNVITKITLEDLGILQLAAHDMFNVDRHSEIDFENGKLDLSTLLLDTTNQNTPFSDENIALGGEARNRENILLFTTSSELGESFLELRDQLGHDIAYEQTINLYHLKLENIFHRVFDESFPAPSDGIATMTENLALRTIHDLLPGQIVFNGIQMSIFDSSLANQKLNPQELSQLGSPLDGIIDAEFRQIDICITEEFCIMVDLLERDSSFAEQFNTESSFEEFLSELEDGRYDALESVMQKIKILFAKGQQF